MILPIRTTFSEHVVNLREKKIKERVFIMSDSEDEGSERQYKIVLVGDSQVGKTAICQR
jgi:GTPase SAR1 family protein